VLEIGIGTGRLAKKVLEAGCGHFTGLDISPATIARAEENLSSWVNKSLICGDFIGYNFNQTFDIIYCSLTLFHFKDKRAFIQKAAGLLRAKGRIVISVPKEKNDSIDFGTREVELYPDDIDNIKVLIADFGLAAPAIIEVDFANILLSQKS
jgi:Methylase involved in ubiquinone/menaquinone biosynthesis